MNCQASSDTWVMAHMPDSSRPGVANALTGSVAGPVVQVGQVEGGVHQHYHDHRTKLAPVSLPYRTGVVPPQAASFQTRLTSRSPSGALSWERWAPTTVLSGLGGVGKTQLAVDYAETMWVAGDVELLMWVAGGSRKAIVSSYARLAADLTGLTDADADAGAERLLEWLAGTQVRWLVVLDDVASPGDVRCLWPPTTPSGRVVVTTRRRDAAFRGRGRRLIEVGVFTADQALAYLEATFADRPELLVDAAQLAAELGLLPLALAQASAYMLDRGISCAAYRARWADRQRSLGELLPDGEGLPDEHRVSVAATWSLSVEQANRLAPLGVAGPLLEVASFLDPNGIPAEVFSMEAVADWLSDRTGRPIHVQDAQDGLGCLQQLSLATLDHGRPSLSGPMVRLHALVQRASREAMEP